MTTRLDKRFFESTRGRIVALMRGTTKTVNELADELELTDNAVRAHLLSLERDGLVRLGGVQRGKRKPHFASELTNEAEWLFPKAYDVLLNQLIAALKGRLTSEEIEEVLKEVGRSLARSQSTGDNRNDLEARIATGLQALASLGGAAHVTQEESSFFINGECCPLALAVAEHPEVCGLAETLLSEIIGAQVHERCEREGTPKCRFEIRKAS